MPIVKDFILDDSIYMACPEICKAGELSGVMKTFENWLWQWLQDYKYPKAMKSYTSNEWTEWNMGYISIKLLFKKKKTLQQFL